jgi:hypothetical protein
MKPGDYKLGSEHSSAAARTALKSRQGGMKRFELWVGHFDDSPPSADPWIENQEHGAHANGWLPGLFGNT